MVHTQSLPNDSVTGGPETLGVGDRDVSFLVPTWDTRGGRVRVPPVHHPTVGGGVSEFFEVS